MPPQCRHRPQVTPQRGPATPDRLAAVNSELTIIRIALCEMYITNLTDEQRGRLHEAIDAAVRIAVEVHKMQATKHHHA